MDGALFVDELRLSRLLQSGLPTPFFLYSRAQLEHDFSAYAHATSRLAGGAMVGYAVKANNNLALLGILAERGAAAIVVSGHEITHALAAGIPGERMLLHGNGKTTADIEAALKHNAMVSVDSEFDLDHIAARTQALGCTARVLLRINPDIDPHVHPYISTGLADSKFGLSQAAIERLRGRLRQHLHGDALNRVEVHGLHCHLGSMLHSIEPIADAAQLLTALSMHLRADGHPVDTIDLGGGLTVDYSRKGLAIPTPDELIDAVEPVLAGSGLKLWLEPGRSLVARCGALVTRVIGSKDRPPAPSDSSPAGTEGQLHRTGEGGAHPRSFLVVDASMAQLIRPALYGAYHHIELVEDPSAGAAATGKDARLFDVVGPICESGDFLGQGRLLHAPAEGDAVIIYDAGAYGMSMASRYNLSLYPAEYLVEGQRVRCIRRAETYEDFARCFVDQPLELPESQPGDEPSNAKRI